MGIESIKLRPIVSKNTSNTTKNASLFTDATKNLSFKNLPLKSSTLGVQNIKRSQAQQLAQVQSRNARPITLAKQSGDKCNGAPDGKTILVGLGLALIGTALEPIPGAQVPATILCSTGALIMMVGIRKNYECQED